MGLELASLSFTLARILSLVLPSQAWDGLYNQAANEGQSTSINSRARGAYVFAADNPFLGDPEAFVKGKDLFRWAERKPRGWSPELQ